MVLASSDSKPTLWAMIRYMWPSFLKHLIDITSFILISVHNFHQIFHFKTYIYRIFMYMISTGKENHFYLEFQCMALGSFLNWFVSTNWAICWKVRLKSIKIELKSTQMLYWGWHPKTIVWKASPETFKTRTSSPAHFQLFMEM